MATNAAKIAKTGKFGDLRRRLVFVLLAPAKAGDGIIAGGPMRAG